MYPCSCYEPWTQISGLTQDPGLLACHQCQIISDSVFLLCFHSDLEIGAILYDMALCLAAACTWIELKASYENSGVELRLNYANFNTSVCNEVCKRAQQPHQNSKGSIFLKKYTAKFTIPNCQTIPTSKKPRTTSEWYCFLNTKIIIFVCICVCMHMCAEDSLPCLYIQITVLIPHIMLCIEMEMLTDPGFTPESLSLQPE